MRASFSQAVDRSVPLAWVLVVVAGLALRLWQLEAQILIDDEWHAIHRLMQAGYRDILLSLGHADYSIPLTLLFRWLAENAVLNDWLLRALPLSFGLATIVLVPRLLSPWLDTREQLVLAALIAVSPLLIHFSRYVRPYSMTVLLGFVAMVMLWRWWHDGGRWRGLLFAVCAVLAAWLHALTALFTGAALLWLTGAGLVRWHRGEGTRDLLRVLALGGATTLACCALVLPPLLSDPHSIAVKAGKHRIGGETLLRSWELVLGVGSPWLGAVLAVPVLAGMVELGRRAPGFLAYWLWMLLFSVAALQAIGPEWILNALVLVRYTAVAQPFVLALAAVGLVVGSKRLLALAGAPAAGPAAMLAALAAVAGLFLAGPLPTVYSGVNQFTNSVRYQLDYDFERSVYHELMGDLELPEAYRRMAAEPGDWEIVETAWHFESHNTPIHQFQIEHRMPIRIGMISGLCTDFTWGELEPDSDQDIRLSRMVFLSELLERERRDNLFVVFHRRPHFEHSRELPDLSACIAAFRERFGAPWFESDGRVVFRLPGSAPAGDA
ncbi:MAG: hypothetical protein GVY32_08345 [Gammaproteobacteria bacterium]|nr:hypothetical protein [Gammaproteobacteria bacterium]